MDETTYPIEWLEAMIGSALSWIGQWQQIQEASQTIAMAMHIYYLGAAQPSGWSRPCYIGTQLRVVGVPSVSFWRSSVA